jgi:hypothetical protein
MSTRTPEVHPYPFTNSSTKPGERIQIDTLTVATDGDNDGYKYVLVITDCFTRWVELYALKTLTQEEAYQHVFDYFNSF